MKLEDNKSGKYDISKKLIGLLHPVLFCLLLGIVLFLVDQVLSLFVQNDIPTLFSSVAYTLTFLVTGIVGIIMVLSLSVFRGKNNNLDFYNSGGPLLRAYRQSRKRLDYSDGDLIRSVKSDLRLGNVGRAACRIISG